MMATPPAGGGVTDSAVMDGVPLLRGAARWRGACLALSGKTLRLFRRAWLRNCFLLLLLPLLLIFLLGMGRLGLPSSTQLGVGAPATLPLAVGSLAGNAGRGKLLAWTDGTQGAAAPADAAAVMATVAAATGLPLLRFPTHADLLSACEGTSTCFAGVSFWPSTLAGGNVTLSYDPSAVPYATDASGLGPLGSAGVLSVQVAVERALLAAANSSLAAPLASASIAVQPFSALTMAEFNAQFYGYYYDFQSQTGAGLAVIAFLPHVFWIMAALVAETESGIRDVLLVAGMPHAVLLASFLGCALLVFLPMWLLIGALLWGLVFTSSTPAAPLVLLLLTGVCLMSFCTALAQLFRRAWIAGMSSLLIIFVCGLAGVGASAANSAAAQAAVATLLAPAGLAVGFGVLARAQEAATPLAGSNWMAAPAGGGLSFGGLLLCMAANAVLNSALAWALTRGLGGAHRGTAGADDELAAGGDSEADAMKAQPGILYTPAAVDGAWGPSGAAAAPPLVRVRGLRKQYTPGAPPAVDGISFDLRADEALCLLGRNGCGKTTTIGMLTGWTAPTAGGATFALGPRLLTLRRDVPAIRQNVGLCPQHDVLWPDLSVRETLAVYAAVKGVPRGAACDAEALAWAARIGLADKADALVRTLSGGQKRRVSLATAYVGGSKVVFLDEPTSGIDPSSRRAVWDIVRANARGRAVVLTTHHLDEGEVLAQRVALMSAGRMLALGSPAALKQRLGLGYYVTCTLERECAAVGAGGPAPAPVAVEAVLRCAAAVLPGVTLHTARGLDVVLDVPLGAAAQALAALVRCLQERSAELRIVSLGVTSASLQDLFVRVVGADEARGEAQAGAAASSNADSVTATSVTVAQPAAAPLAPLAKQPSAAWRVKPPGCSRRMAVLLRKRALLAAREPLLAGLPLIVAVLLAIVAAAAFRGLQFADCPATLVVTQPALSVTSADGSPTLFGPLEFLSALPAAIPVAAPPGGLVLAQAPTAAAGTAALAANASVLYGGLLPSATGPWPNVTAAFQVNGPGLTDAASVNAANNAIWRAALGSTAASPPGVATSLQPFPAAISAADSGDLAQTAAFIFVVVVAWTVLPLASTAVVAKERLGGMKSQQHATGVTSLQLWAAHLLWDAAMLLLCCIIAAAGLAGGMPAWRPDYGATLVLLFVTGLSATLIGYGASLAAPSVTAAVAIAAAYNLLIAAGIFAAIVTQLGGSTSPSALASGVVLQAVTYAGMAVDPLAGLLWGAMLGSNAFLMACGGDTAQASMWSYMQLGRPMVIVAAQALLLAAGVVLADMWPAWRMRVQLRRSLDAAERSPRFPEHAAGQPRPGTAEWPAATAAGEAAGGAADRSPGAGKQAQAGAALLLHDLERVYPGGLVGVTDVQLRVETGEALGLLGVNGAGKSTLVRCILGLDAPTRGEVVVAGRSLARDAGAATAGLVGYTPQFDVLFPALSAEEHLRLYGGLKGLSGPLLEDEVRWLLAALDLGAARTKPSSALSGGNRRKLSVAIALLGSPPLVVLDEPSTGMDPLSKVALWRALGGLREAGQALVLVTHSMDECEAVAQRVAVMAAGRMQALGTAQQLKSRWGAALQADVELSPQGSPAGLAAQLAAAFPGATLLEEHGRAVRLAVPSGTGGDSSGTAFCAVFEWLAAAQARGEVAAFTVSQATLEQVFLDLVRAAGERPPPDAAEDANAGRGSALYWEVPGESFSWSAYVWLLIVSPVLSWLLMAVVLPPYLCALGLAMLPPLARPFARATLGGLRWAMRTERAAQRRFCLLPAQPASQYPAAAPEGGGAGSPSSGCCARAYGAAMAQLFLDGPTRRALLYMTLTKPFVLAMEGIGVATVGLVVGCASVFMLWPTGCILVRRHVVWQRRWLQALGDFRA